MVLRFIRNTTWAIAVLLLPGGVAWASSELGPEALTECHGDAPRVALAWQDHTGVAVRVDVVEREVRQVFASAGIGVDWRVAAPDSEPRAKEIAIVLLPRSTGRSRPGNAMGAVRKASGDRTARVFLAGVEGLLGVKATGEHGRRPAAREQLARALGRVAAHEVVHLVAPALGHTAQGLMEAQMQLSFALRPEVALDEETREAIRAAVRQAPPGTSLAYDSSPPSSSCTRSL